MQRFGIIATALALSVCDASQAQAQAQSIQVPADQRALSDVLAKFNDLDAATPNDIQCKKIEVQFRQEFCARIPQGNVSGWIGEVGSVDDRGPDKDIRLDMSVNIFDLHSGALGVELSLGNYYAYGVTGDNTRRHLPTVIPVGSPLYDFAENLRSGDVIRFIGTFIPYISAQACYDNDTTYFAPVHFDSLQRIGYGAYLH